MNREILKQIIADQRQYKPPKLFFDRTQSEQIKKFAGDPSIVIITGMRRTGKSTIQRLFQKEYLESDYYFNFDDERLIHFKLEHFQMLLETLIEVFGSQSTYYFDEIQNIEGWERFVRRLYESGTKIFITGSNAKLLSKELGTHLTGRTIQVEIYPLSFKELMQYKHPEILEEKILSTEHRGLLLRSFADYFEYGGIPEYTKFRKQEYLKDLYEGILYRDIVARHKINQEKSLLEMIYYFASNIGKEFNYSKLAKLVGLNSSNTVSSYCTYLEQCYLCFFLCRYSHSLKKQILYNKKCYMIDPALIRLVGFRVSEDKGRILENIVFLHLKMEGKEVYFHKEKKECDFLVREKNKIAEAIQVSVALSNPEVEKREVEGLIEAMKTYGLKTGTIITENEHRSVKIDNYQVEVIPIWKFLLGI